MSIWKHFAMMYFLWFTFRMVRCTLATRRLEFYESCWHRANIRKCFNLNARMTFEHEPSMELQTSYQQQPVAEEWNGSIEWFRPIHAIRSTFPILFNPTRNLTMKIHVDRHHKHKAPNISLVWFRSDANVWLTVLTLYENDESNRTQKN